MAAECTRSVDMNKKCEDKCIVFVCVRMIPGLFYIPFLFNCFVSFDQSIHIMFCLPSLNSRTVALLAIVCGLVVLCLGLWHIWNAQQTFSSEMQYVRSQCDNLQKQMGQTSTKSIVESADVHSHSNTVSTTEIPTQTQVVEDVVHRSCELVDAADAALTSSLYSTSNVVDTDLSASDDDSTEDDASEYNDNDRVVDTADLVEESSELAESTVNASETENELVETLLSTLVQQVESTDDTPTELAVVNDCTSTANDLDVYVKVKVDAKVPTTAEEHADAADENSNVENFVQNNGNYAAFAETLRKKTVVELKKMCAEHHIGTKKGKSFKRKEELIEELVEKMPQQTA